MRTFIGVLLYCQVNIFLLVTPHNSKTLELVHVIFRHGDRTPDQHTIYPNDPHINETYYPFGYGQLTNMGKKKEYFVGKFLRKRYGKTFLHQFTVDEVDARSTNYNRTKASLQLVLASLFPAEGNQIWYQGIKWQPVPFNYWPVEDDHVIGDPIVNCRNYIRKYYEHMNTTKVTKLYQKYNDSLVFLSAKTGLVLNPKTAAELYFTLTIEKENYKPNPSWAVPFLSTIAEFAYMDYITSTDTDELKKLSSGFLVKKIIEDTEAKITAESETKIFLYSSHEYNIAYLLRFLGVYFPHVPPYGSFIIIEIHNVNNTRRLKFFYQDYQQKQKLKKLKLPRCGKFCLLKTFKKNYKHLLPTSQEECS